MERGEKVSMERKRRKWRKGRKGKEEREGKKERNEIEREIIIDADCDLYAFL
jgi:hypothetical protein